MGTKVGEWMFDVKRLKGTNKPVGSDTGSLNVLLVLGFVSNQIFLFDDRLRL